GSAAGRAARAAGRRATRRGGRHRGGRHADLRPTAHPRDRRQSADRRGRRRDRGRRADHRGGSGMRDDFALTDEQRIIRDLARKAAREKIARWAAEVDEQERYPTESLEAVKEAGLYGIWVPEEYGGSDMGCLALALVCEEIAWACAASATQFLDQPLGGLPI